MSSSEEFPEYLVKLCPDQGKFFCKLLSHSDIQLFDDLIKGILCRDKVIMLGLHELVTLRDLFIILDRIDIDISESADRVLPFSDLAFHIRRIRQGLIPEKLRCREGETIFIPHIVHLGILAFRKLVVLVLKTHQFFI